MRRVVRRVLLLVAKLVLGVGRVLLLVLLVLMLLLLLWVLGQWRRPMRMTMCTVLLLLRRRLLRL